mmetsp:Transcript_21000/g.70521  ORF Transcript_21000/g.70521 Transcript_21000/m.70521 type:complete len:287 (-) Transcript_21000:11-871(-)
MVRREVLASVGHPELGQHGVLDEAVGLEELGHRVRAERLVERRRVRASTHGPWQVPGGGELREGARDQRAVQTVGLHEVVHGGGLHEGRERAARDRRVAAHVRRRVQRGLGELPLDGAAHALGHECEHEVHGEVVLHGKVRDLHLARLLQRGVHAVRHGVQVPICDDLAIEEPQLGLAGEEGLHGGLDVGEIYVEHRLEVRNVHPAAVVEDLVVHLRHEACRRHVLFAVLRVDDLHLAALHELGHDLDHVGLGELELRRGLLHLRKLPLEPRDLVHGASRPEALGA